MLLIAQCLFLGWRRAEEGWRTLKQRGALEKHVGVPRSRGTSACIIVPYTAEIVLK